MSISSNTNDPFDFDAFLSQEQEHEFESNINSDELNIHLLNGNVLSDEGVILEKKISKITQDTIFNEQAQEEKIFDEISIKNLNDEMIFNHSINDIEILFFNLQSNSTKIKIYDKEIIQNRILSGKTTTQELGILKKTEKHDGSIIFETSEENLKILENADEIIEKTKAGKTVIDRNKFTTKAMSQDDYERYNRIFQKMISDIVNRILNERKNEEDNKKHKNESNDSVLSNRVYPLQQVYSNSMISKETKNFINFAAQLMKLERSIQKINNEKFRKLEEKQEEKRAKSKEIAERESKINQTKVDHECENRNDNADFIKNKKFL